MFINSMKTTVKVLKKATLWWLFNIPPGLDKTLKL